MKTRIKKLGDSVVVALDGKVDYETQEPFRQDLQKLVSENKQDSAPKSFVFDLGNLEFVGSSGITHLIQTLKDFTHQTGARPRYVNVGSEFQKIMRAFDETGDFDLIDGSLVNRSLPKLTEQ
jgi:anti-anti-sigma factor